MSISHKIPKVLIVILLVSIILRLFRIGESFYFNFDQQYVANRAYELIVNKHLSLLGQELSYPGVFLGPFHNLIFSIPYFTCNLLPDCVTYFALILSLITIGLLYLLLSKIFDKKIAFIASLVMSLSFTAIEMERSANSNFFLIPISVCLIYCIEKYLKGKDNYFILGSFLCGFAVANFNPVFIYSAIFLFITSFFQKEKKLKTYIFGFSAFLVNFLPFLIFNFRHDNILLNNLINFKEQQFSINVIGTGFLILRKIIFAYYSNLLFHSNSLFTSLLVAGTFLFAITITLKQKEILFRLMSLWVLIVLVGFSFYKGHIEDYYFQQTVVPFLILIALVLKKNKMIFIIFIAAILFSNLKASVNTIYTNNYLSEKKLIKSIVSNSGNEDFKVYYELPIVADRSFVYLFKAYGKSPNVEAEDLYIITNHDKLMAREDYLRKTFKNYTVEKSEFSKFRLLSIKPNQIK